MFSEDTKKNLEEIKIGADKVLQEEKNKVSTDLLKSPAVVSVTLFLLLSIGANPYLLFLIVSIYSVVLLFRSAPPKTIANVTYQIPRDLIKHRKKIAEDVKNKVTENLSAAKNALNPEVVNNKEDSVNKDLEKK